MSQTTLASKWGNNAETPRAYSVPASTELDWGGYAEMDVSLLTHAVLSSFTQYGLNSSALVPNRSWEYTVQIKNNLRRAQDYLSAFEIEDVLESKRERSLGHTRRFSDVADLVEWLNSE
jgi:hypothetical protein